MRLFTSGHLASAIDHIKVRSNAAPATYAGVIWLELVDTIILLFWVKRYGKESDKATIRSLTSNV